MAYISTEQVKSIRDQIKAAYPNYKWSVSRRDHSTVVIVLQESDLPFDNVHEQINPYWFKESEKLNTKTKLIFQHVLFICNSVERCYDRNAGDQYADYGDSTCTLLILRLANGINRIRLFPLLAPGILPLAWVKFSRKKRLQNTYRNANAPGQ